MAKRIVHRRKLQKIAIGDMTHRPTLRRRSLLPGGVGSAGFTETEIDLGVVWAKVDTPDTDNSGELVFAGVNLNPNTTTIFCIRYWSTVTTEDIVNWKNENYEILQLFDLDKREQFLILACRLKGDDTKEANS